MGTEPRMHYFQLLSHDEQRAAIHRLANSGMSDYTIAAATGLSVEMVRVILGERTAAGAN
jgi:DNA-binding CsgD family transcriptional regulator